MIRSPLLMSRTRAAIVFLRTRLDLRSTPNAAAAAVSKKESHQFAEVKITGATLPKRSWGKKKRNFFEENSRQKAETLVRRYAGNETPLRAWRVLIQRL